MRKQKLYRHALFLMLAVTRAFNRADLNLPTKWYSLVDSLRASSGVLHTKISMIDEDVEKEFREVEKQLDRRLGNEKFYSEEEVEELREKINDIKI